MDQHSKNLQFPESRDVWQCCQDKCYQYSSLISHIENQHLNYSNSVQSNSKGTIFKYSCEDCGNKFFSYKIAITHHLNKHIDHWMVCIQCCSNFESLEDFKAHVYKCNFQFKAKIHKKIEWSISAQKNSDSD